MLRITALHFLSTPHQPPLNSFFWDKRLPLLIKNNIKLLSFSDTRIVREVCGTLAIYIQGRVFSISDKRKITFTTVAIKHQQIS